MKKYKVRGDFNISALKDNKKEQKEITYMSKQEVLKALEESNKNHAEALNNLAK